MQRHHVVFPVCFLCFALAGCKATPGSTEAGGGRTVPAASPESGDAVPAAADGAVERPDPPDPADAAVPDVGPGAEAAETPADAPAVERPAGPPPRVPVEIRIRLRGEAERYVGYARYWTDRLRLERLGGDTWTAVAYSAGLCTDPCPEDGTVPHCGFCSPPTPMPSYRAASGLGTYSWPAILYEGRQGDAPHCFCHFEVAAPPGRYRFTLCTHPEVSCDTEPCAVAGTDEGFGTVAGDEACDSVEFDYAGEPLEVVLPVGAPAAPGE
jgi:hypothetical protein